MAMLPLKSAGLENSDKALQPGEGGGAVVLFDVAVIFAGEKVRVDVRDAVGQPPGVGDGKEVLQAEGAQSLSRLNRRPTPIVQRPQIASFRARYEHGR
jgi:hypothetical protein